MSYTIRPIRLLDYLRIIPHLRDVDVRGIRNMADQEPGDAWAASSFLRMLAGFAMEDETGKVYGIAGVTQVRTGVLHVWAVATKYYGGIAALNSFRFLKKMFENIEAKTDNHRIECYVLRDFEDAHRVVKRLGFTEEGVQRAAGSNREDVVTYSRSKS